MSSTVGDIRQAHPVQPDESWVEESLQRYTNPNAFAAKSDETGPTPVLQEEISLASPEGRDVKLQVHLMKERWFWSRISLLWTFRLADVEGDEDAQRVVVMLAFDTWTGAVQISENAVLKVDELQKPIAGGEWATKTDFGKLVIKIVPFWTGYQYELWHDGKEVYKHFA